jgi:shikimate dehydrogenase
MQNAAFAAVGIDAVYVPFPVAAEDLKATLAGLHAAGVAGLNVTVPHRGAAARLAVALRPRARACGAANTLIRTPRGWVGDNTDGARLLAALAEHRFDPRGKNVLLIGAGGSARSVAHAFARAGTRLLIVANRTPKRAVDLVATLRRRDAYAADLGVLANPEVLGRLDLLVNCTSTSLGSGALPTIRFVDTRRDLLCCDLMYGKTSSFLAQARRARRRALDGTACCCIKDALAFALWTKRPSPIEVMRRALSAPSRSGIDRDGLRFSRRALQGRIRRSSGPQLTIINGFRGVHEELRLRSEALGVGKLTVGSIVTRRRNLAASDARNGRGTDALQLHVITRGRGDATWKTGHRRRWPRSSATQV